MPIDFKPKATSTIQFKPVQPSITPQPKQDGFIETVAKSVVSPFARLGVNAVKAGQMIAGQKVDPAKPMNVPWLGQVKPVGQEGSFGRRVLDAVGVGTEVAANVIPTTAPVRSVVPLAKASFRGAVTQGLKTGVRSGGVTGTLYGAGSELQNPNATIGSVATNALTNGTIGAATGGVLGTTLPLPVAAAKGLSQVAQKLTTPLTIRKRVTALDKLQNNNKPLSRAIVSADKSGLDTKKFIAESNLLSGAVDKTGTINAKTAIGNLDEILQPWEAKVGEAIQAEGKTVPLLNVKLHVMEAIDKAGLLGNVRTQALARLNGDLEDLARIADPQGNIPLSRIHDLKVQTNQLNAKSYLNPESNQIGKTIGFGLKDFIEKNTNALDVQTYNGELRKLYAVRDVLHSLDGKKVEGGRMGKHFAGVVGAVAGNAVGGPIGAVAGAEAASFAKGVQMSRAFGGKAGKSVEISELMKGALKPQSKSLGNLQIPQTTTTANVSNAIPRSKAQYNFPSSSLTPKPTSYLQEMLQKAKDEGQKGAIKNPFKAMPSASEKRALTEQLKAVETKIANTKDKGIAKGYAKNRNAIKRRLQEL